MKRNALHHRMSKQAAGYNLENKTLHIDHGNDFPVM